jgi:hypothetical protein
MHEHYNYLQLIRIYTNWKLFTKYIKKLQLKYLGFWLEKRYLITN